MNYINTQKQYIRIWFEFYKMALKDPELSANIGKSREFYKPWGDVTDKKFDIWWKENRSLFGQSHVAEIDRVHQHPNTLNVAIPLNLPVSTTMKQLKQLVEQKQLARIEELGLESYGRKTKSISFGQYEVTEGIEIRGKTLYEIQLMYSIWLEMGKPAINTEFCLKVVEWMKSRPRAKWIPYLLQQDPTPDKKGNLRYTDDQLRQVRRYIKKGEKVCEAVSKGQFPGKNRL